VSQSAEPQAHGEARPAWASDDLRPSRSSGPQARGEAPDGSAAHRREQLKELYYRTRSCARCAALARTRKSVVFGAGNADAQLMFVGEAPGASEDEQGLPFVGRAGRLLDQLLGEIGMERGDVFIANVLKCRPPGNRDPQPAEIENCRDYLYAQLELIAPRVLCTLGNFATKLLRGSEIGISRVHGRAEIATIGPWALRLYPLYHPAAALRSPSVLEALRADFQRIPQLLAMAPPEQRGDRDLPRISELLPDQPEGGALAREGDREREERNVQLGLF
jgi:uracil-DNA glycosylase family 4